MLDNVVSDAVAEFSYQRDGLAAARKADDTVQQMGCFLLEIRNLLGTASLAFAAMWQAPLHFAQQVPTLGKTVGAVGTSAVS